MVYDNYNAFVIIMKSNRGDKLNEVISETILNEVTRTQVTQMKRERAMTEFTL